MPLVNCIIYLSLTGALGFVVGRLSSRYHHFNPDAFPYRTFSFEKDGEIYEKLGIKSWQGKVPDMSRIVPSLIPSKNMSGTLSAKKLSIMLQETCVAEFVHYLLCLSGLYGCFHFLRPAAAVIVYILYLFTNVPCMIIQRYNRPRLKRVLQSCVRRETLPAYSASPSLGTISDSEAKHSVS